MKAWRDLELERVIGKLGAKKLSKLGLITVSELLYYFPRRYEMPGVASSFDSVQAGEHITVQANVQDLTMRSMNSRRGKIATVRITDGTTTLPAVFFAPTVRMERYLEGKLKPGSIGLFTGTVKAYRGELQLSHPDMHMFDSDGDADAERQFLLTHLLAIYRASNDVASWQIANAMRTLLDQMTSRDPADPIPVELRKRWGLPALDEALRGIHTPRDRPELAKALKRFKYEEALILQVALARLRRSERLEMSTPRPGSKGGTLAAFDNALPFELTAGQREVGNQIAEDLTASHPMHRLLQGEVGSGKTVVALRAMLQIVDSGGQAVLLAPTEVLAAQHARSISQMLGPIAEQGLFAAEGAHTEVALLTGSLPAARKKQVLADIQDGRAGVIVGTHALLSDPVKFADLGLVVVDEQHRFGVRQRDILRERAGKTPHMLVMTATPIPRTVAISVFGNLDISTLTDVPRQRAGADTFVVPAARPAWVRRVWERVAQACELGHQVFVVVPRISAGETDTDPGPQKDLAQPGLEGDSLGIPLASVESMMNELEENSLTRGLRIAELHGKLTPDAKDRTMAAFSSGELDVLVATTVIEVGVDIPNATIMVVMDADFFGLAQLHQLRGRVGRGSERGTCFLVTRAPDGTPAHERLDVLAGTSDGFKVALADLESRREGDVLGDAQSGGANSLKVLRVVRDAEIISEVQDVARELVESDPELDRHPELAARVERELGDREEYLDRS